MTINDKWKKALLKTGLPLEYVTSNIFNKLNHEIFGEYPYIRPDETKHLREFSVDIRTWKCLDDDDKLIIFSTLVECKFRQPGTTWVFSPYPSEIMPSGILNSTEDLVPYKIGSEAVWKFEEELGYCIGGVELTNDGNGNTKGVKHGVFQLRFAMPEFLKNEYASALDSCYNEGRYLDLSCGILVTTADLRVIKPGLKLENFTSAEDIDEVTEKREAVIINETSGPQLVEFSNEIATKFFKDYPNLRKRLQDIENVLDGEEWENRSAPDLDTIKRSFNYSAERILVINYNHLEGTIKKLEEAIKQDIAKGKIYGRIQEENNFEIVRFK